jgi:hypothetical protein
MKIKRENMNAFHPRMRHACLSGNVSNSSGVFFYVAVLTSVGIAIFHFGQFPVTPQTLATSNDPGVVPVSRDSSLKVPALSTPDNGATRRNFTRGC